ncbi:MAG TPA: carboxypeptidase-like regulatory domain-containing protein [Candidatus Thermoplasmatota archaeon]|nr:carboxypeptidase-like regulatory domain-containing protein [Candidatus Thermoplasmatota archaeon]
MRPASPLPRLLLATVALLVLSGCVATGPPRLVVAAPHLGDTAVFLRGDGSMSFEGGGSGDFTVGLGQAAPILAGQVLHNYGGPPVTNAISKDFVLPPLATDQVLNASSPIVFTMYWSTTGTILHDQLCYAAQVTSNDAPIAQGQACTEALLLVPTLGVTYTSQMAMMSEVPRLAKGSVVKLHLTFLGTLTDFRMSLTPPLQSHLNVSFVPDIAGDVYLDSYGGAVTPIEGSGTPLALAAPAPSAPAAAMVAQSAGDAAAPLPAPSRPGRPEADNPTVPRAAADPALPGTGALLGTFLALPLVALAFVQGPRRPKAHAVLLVLLLALGAGLAGCSGKKPPAANEPQPTVEQYYAIPDSQRQAALEKSGSGDLRGRVFYDIGLPLKGAHVSLLGTDHFKTADEKGRFEFLALPPTDYTLRIDSEGFRSVQQVVTVQKGTITQLNVTMVPLGQAGNSATTAHKHDVWGRSTMLEFFNGDSEAPQGPGDINGLPVGRSLDACAYYTGMAAPTSTGPGGGSSTALCVLGIFPDAGMLVFPGTAMIDVTLSWDAAKDNVDAAGIAFIPANLNNPLLMAQKPSGSTWHIPVSQAMADRGHQGFTLWSFYVYVAGSGSTYAPTEPNMVLQAPFQVKMTLHKGLIPFEPAHRDFWMGNQTIEVLHDGVHADPSVHYRDYPVEEARFLLPIGKLVPPGTGTLELKLSWKGSTGTGGSGATYDSFGKWTLAVHPANLQPHHYAESELIHPEATERTATSATFLVPVDPAQTDAYYQQKSNWVFLLQDASGATVGEVNLSDLYYNMEFHLQAIAHLSPQYTFSKS